MKVPTFTIRVIQLNTYLLYFLPDRPGQLVTSPNDDDIKEMLYHAMPNTWKEKMVQQGFKSLDGPIHSMVEFFEIRIENLKNQSYQVFPQETEKSRKKGPRKGNQ